MAQEIPDIAPPTAPPSPPPGGGSLSWPRLVLALVYGPFAGLLWARAGEMAESYFGQMIFLSVVVAVLAGLTVVALVRFTQTGNRATILLAAVLAGSFAAVGQHYFRYLYQDELRPVRAIAGHGGRPASPGQPGDLLLRLPRPRGPAGPAAVGPAACPRRHGLAHVGRRRAVDGRGGGGGDVAGDARSLLRPLPDVVSNEPQRQARPAAGTAAGRTV